MVMLWAWHSKLLMILWIIVKQQRRRLVKPVGNDLREGLLTYPLLSIVNDDNKDKLLEDIKALNNGGDEQAIIDYVIGQGGIDNTLAVADQYCKDALAALDAVRDFPGKEFLVMAVENLADRKV